MFTLKMFILSGKSATSLSVQLKVGSSCLLTWFFLLYLFLLKLMPCLSSSVLFQQHIDNLFHNILHVVWAGHCKAKMFGNSIYQQNVNMVLMFTLFQSKRITFSIFFERESSFSSPKLQSSCFFHSRTLIFLLF